jgi:DNA (cytosine-5)-methyltransferase 1
MKVGSLFSGCGGFELGLERVGLTTEWQVEIDPFCRRVLEKHWPNVRRWDDVRTFPPRGDWRVDVVCGGFPCTDISNAGRRAGIYGEQSGLWREYARVIGILRPRFVLVENVAALLVRGIGRVLGDLAHLGYDAEWSVVSACSMGAPHARKRLFVVAYPVGERLQGPIFGRKSVRGTERTSSAQFGNRSISCGDHWGANSRDILLGDGVSQGMGRRAVKAYGNSIVPQCSEWIGRRLMEAINEI